MSFKLAPAYYNSFDLSPPQSFVYSIDLNQRGVDRQLIRKIIGYVKLVSSIIMKEFDVQVWKKITNFKKF